MINQAQQKHSENKDEEAISLIKTAVNSCEEILKESKTRVPKLQNLTLGVYLPIIISVVALLLSALAVLIIMYVRRGKKLKDITRYI